MIHSNGPLIMSHSPDGPDSKFTIHAALDFESILSENPLKAQLAFLTKLCYDSLNKSYPRGA